MEHAYVFQTGRHVLAFAVIVGFMVAYGARSYMKTRAVRIPAKLLRRSE